MAKVLLIRPPQIHWKEEAKRVGIPLGLLSIAANLEKHGHEVSFIDATVERYEQERNFDGKNHILEYGLSDQELKEKIANFDPEFVGITSTHTYFWKQVIKVARLVKECNSKIKVIVGGHHASGVAEWILKTVPDIDIVVKGEAEVSILKLLNNPPSNRAIIEGGYVDLESIPIPKFELIQSHVEKYNSLMSHFGKPKGKSFITNLISRGCPQYCTFCTTSYYFGKELRFYSDEQIQQQIDKICELGFEEYVMQDDNILAFPEDKRLIYFEILKRAIDDKTKSLKYWNLDGGLYYSLVQERHIGQLKEYGCYRVFLPIDGIKTNSVHKFNKYKNVKNQADQKSKIFQVIEWLNKYNIEFYSAILIGYPNETIKEIKEAVKLAEEIKSAGAIGVCFHWLHPFPNTPIYNEFYYKYIDEKRKWEENPEYYTLIRPVITLKGQSLDELESYIDRTFKTINNINVLNNSGEYKMEPKISKNINTNKPEDTLLINFIDIKNDLKELLEKYLLDDKKALKKIKVVFSIKDKNVDGHYINHPTWKYWIGLDENDINFEIVNNENQEILKNLLSYSGSILDDKCPNIFFAKYDGSGRASPGLEWIIDYIPDSLTKKSKSRIFGSLCIESKYDINSFYQKIICEFLQCYNNNIKNCKNSCNSCFYGNMDRDNERSTDCQCFKPMAKKIYEILNQNLNNNKLKKQIEKIITSEFLPPKGYFNFDQDVNNLCINQKIGVFRFFFRLIDYYTIFYPYTHVIANALIVGGYHILTFFILFKLDYENNNINLGKVIGHWQTLNQILKDYNYLEKLKENINEDEFATLLGKIESFIKLRWSDCISTYLTEISVKETPNTTTVNPIIKKGLSNILRINEKYEINIGE